MLFIIGLLIIGAAALAMLRVRVPGGVNAAHLGWMSEQWLVEYRAANRS